MFSSVHWVLFAGWSSLLSALLHIAAIFGGPTWYAFFRAPACIVSSAEASTWQAPASALVIATLLAVCSAYAFSAANYLPRLPLLRVALGTIAVICLLRGALLPISLFIILQPHLMDTFVVVSSAIWFVIGVGFAVGFQTSAISH
jgi:hypothetical protein